MLCILVRFAHFISGLLIQALLLVIMTGQIFGDVYYVNSNAPPGGQGTYLQPWQNFLEFDINDYPESIINVSPGSYNTFQLAGNNETAVVWIKNTHHITIKKEVHPLYPPPPGETEARLNGINGNTIIDFGIRIYPESIYNTVTHISIIGISFENFRKNAIQVLGVPAINNWEPPYYVETVDISECIISKTVGINNVNISCAGIFSQFTKDLTIGNNKITQQEDNFVFPTQTEGIYLGGCSDITIQNNYIKLHHITPLQQPPNEPPHIDGIHVTLRDDIMSRNVTIKQNIIVNTGRNLETDIQTRSGIHVLKTDGDILIMNNNIVVPYGKDLINAWIKGPYPTFEGGGTNSLKIYNNILVSIKPTPEDPDANPTTQMEIVNDILYLVNPNILDIKNNIFYKEGSSTDNKPTAIVFKWIPSESITSERLNYNLFYNSQGTSPTIYFEKPYTWYFNGTSLTSLNADPQFELPPEGDKYKIQITSPAINFGIRLNELSVDLEGNRRPYWPNGTDLGAFEIPEAQLRIGLQSGGPVTHTIQAVGEYWEKDEELASWQISSDPTIAYNTYTSEYIPGDKVNWNGFHFKWLIPDGAVESAMGHAFYRVSTGVGTNEKFFYIDFRDAVTNYNPNIYIKYQSTPTPLYFYWNIITEQFEPIDNGTVLRVWQIKNGSPNTSILNDFWTNCLVQVEDNNDHPKFVWGPYPETYPPGLPITRYYIYRSQNHSPGNPPPPPYPELAYVSSITLEYVDLNVTIGSGTNSRSYYVRGYKGGIEGLTSSTNIVEVSLERQGKISNTGIKPEFKLMQNYPNPFNPVTRIAFSIPEDTKVSLVIYDILGKEIKNLVNENLTAGIYDLDFNAGRLATGIYFYRLTAGKYSETKKLQLIK